MSRQFWKSFFALEPFRSVGDPQKRLETSGWVKLGEVRSGQVRWLGLDYFGKVFSPSNPSGVSATHKKDLKLQVGLIRLG
jgi:hypothetical protein